MNRIDLESGLTEIGLSRGDTVLLHSSLSSLGTVDGGAETVIEAFLSVLGPDGTLVVPTFGSLGIITESLKNRPEAVPSIHPRASVAAIGAHAEDICRDHWKAETAHTIDTPYARIADLDGYVILMGVDQDRNTTLHAVEALLELPYLNRTQEMTFSTPDGDVTRSWPHFPGPHRDFIGLDRLLREEGIVQVNRIGNAVIRKMKSRDLIDRLFSVGKLDAAFMLCDNPECADCTRQRAAISRKRYSDEDFVVAASGLLAGRYVPQMIETCKSIGIDAIELDYIQGEPVQLIPRERLSTAVAELDQGGCKVISLRASAITEDIASLLDTAVACGLHRVVLPLTEEAADLAESAAQQGVSLSFFNTYLGGVLVHEKMAGLRREGLSANLTLNPANFAKAGEKPFLKSYGSKLKPFMDQLDVEDCTFDGRFTSLGRGNAEIKELISILRCSSFAGYMVLGAANQNVGDLGSAAGAFLHLLDGI